MKPARTLLRLLTATTMIVFVLGLIGSAAASADPHHVPKKHDHHSKGKTRARKPVTKKTVTLCDGLGGVKPQSVWLDHRGDHAGELSKLICTAADHAVVLVKMYFIVNDPGAAATFLRDVELMHRYHHVQFRFVVDTEVNDRSAARNIKLARKATPGTEWFGCHNSCLSTRPDAISHSKFIAVSELRTTHRPALLTTSTNISQQQLAGTLQSGILFTDNAPLYARFVREFTIYRSCAEHLSCSRRPSMNSWQQYGSASIYFSPDSIDPIAADLRQLDCSKGGTIQIVSLWLRSPGLVNALRKNQAAGCKIQVIVEHPEVAASVAKEFGARTMTQHDKYLIVNTPQVHRVYAGTQDFGPKALHDNDNFMVRSTNSSVVAAYEHEFHYQWARSVSSSSARAARIAQAAARTVDG